MYSRLTSNALVFQNGATENVKLTGSNALVTLNGPSDSTVRITGLADPVANTDAATKSYVDTRPIDALSDVSIAQGNLVHGQAPTWNASTAQFENSVLVWKDLIGTFDVRSGGGATPYTIYQYDTAGNFWEYATTDGVNKISQAFLSYHVPHDWLPGTDMFIHLHLSTTATTTNTCAFVVRAGVAQSGSSIPELTTIGTITKTFAGANDIRRHYVVEIPLTGIGLIDLNDMDIDSIIFVQLYYQRGANGDNMGNTEKTFLHFMDIHYQGDGTLTGTVNRVAPFR